MKIKKIEEIEENGNESDDQIELKKETIVVETPVKERKPYVMTEARKQAFEKARQKRQENIDIRKKQQQQLIDEQEAIKQAVLEKRNRQLIKKNKKEIKKIIQNEDLLSSSSDEEIIIKKKHPSKKKVYVIEEDEEKEPQKVNKPLPIQQPPRRIIQFY